MLAVTFPVLRKQGPLGTGEPLAGRSGLKAARAGRSLAGCSGWQAAWWQAARTGRSGRLLWQSALAGRSGKPLAGGLSPSPCQGRPNMRHRLGASIVITIIWFAK